jgi:hypothetical protein
MLLVSSHTPLASSIYHNRILPGRNANNTNSEMKEIKQCKHCKMPPSELCLRPSLSTSVFVDETNIARIYNFGSMTPIGLHRSADILVYLRTRVSPVE